MKTFSLSFLLLIISIMSFSQVKTKLTKEKISVQAGIFNAPASRKIEIVNIDYKQAQKEAAEQDKRGVDHPYHFAKGKDVTYSLTNSGEWFAASNGRVWKLKIKSENALSLSLIFKRLILSGKTELYIYNEDETMVFGPVVKKSIPKNGKFKSDVIKGDVIILELFEPASETGKNILEIARVVHGFRDIFQPLSFGDSNLSCQDDVCCASTNWQNVSNGVCLIFLADNESSCSGALLNDASQDFIPYILTAFHCVDVGTSDPINLCDSEFGNGTISAGEIANVEDWAFRFQYKRTSCNSGSEPYYYTFQQATFRSGYFGSDFALVEMNENPLSSDPNTNIKFLGWSRSNTPPTSGAYLGHPLGDVMKISIFGNVASNTSAINFVRCPYVSNTVSEALTQWETTITDGANEPGSSGGPVFDQNFRVVGQVHGGVVGCAQKTLWAGRLDTSWVGGRTNTTRLSNWLTNDPDITQTNTVSMPAISGPYNVCSSGTEYFITNLPPETTITWGTYEGIERISSQGSNPCVFQATNSGYEDYIYASITRNGNTVTLYPKRVWVGTYLTPTDVSSIDPAYRWQPFQVCVNNPGNPGDAYYYWMITNYINANVDDSQGTLCPYIYSYDPGDVYLAVTTINSCNEYSDYFYLDPIYVEDYSQRLTLSPNPASGSLKISLSDELKESSLVEIYNSQSNKIMSATISGKEKTLDVSKLQSGFYVVKVYLKGKEKPYLGKFIKK